MAVSATAPHIVTRPGSFRDGVLWALVAAYAIVYFLLGWIRYASHGNFVDLGIFAQTAASAFGCFCNSIEGSHWAFHFSPILYFAGALMQVWHSALALIALQAIGGALTAPPIYGIVRRSADRKSALLAALVVLLYPPLGGVIFNDFHENGLAPAAVAWLLWAFDGGFIVATIIFALLTLAIKEDQALFLIVAGIVGAIAYRGDRIRFRLAAGIAVTAAVVFVVFFAAIQPHANPSSHWAPERFFVIAHPSWGFAFLRAGYVLLAFVPLLFIPFRTWAVLLALPPFIEVLSSSMATTYTMGSHYAGAWLGYTFFAFAIGVVAVARKNLHRAHRLLYWCLALCVVEFAVADPLHPGYFLHAPRTRDAGLNRFLASLPPDIDVATQEEAYTHLAATDPHATLVPEISADTLHSCYLLLDEDYPRSVRLLEFRSYASDVKGYRAVRRDDGITLYRSEHCPQSNPPTHQRR